MRVECLLVARDPNLLRMLTSSLTQLGIDANVCPDAEEAADWLHRSKFDSVMVDCVEFDLEGPRLLQKIRRAAPNSRSVIVAIVDNETTPVQRGALGAHFVLERPLQPDMLSRSLRAARSLMIQENRRYFRHPVDMPAWLIKSSSETRVQLTNVSMGGLAFQMERKSVEIGWTGQVDFTIPGQRERAQFKAEVVWMNEHLKGGVKFVHIPAKQRQDFENWLADMRGEPKNLR